MDFQELFNNLQINVSLCEMGMITRDEEYRYIKGVFDTLKTLGLMDNYNTWCRDNNIIVVDEDRLAELYG